MKCPDCGAEMKPLALSVYCPNDCDRKVQQVIEFEKTQPYRKTSAASSKDPDPVYYFSPSSTGSIDIDDCWWDGLGWDTD